MRLVGQPLPDQEATESVVSRKLTELISSTATWASKQFLIEEQDGDSHSVMFPKKCLDYSAPAFMLIHVGKEKQ